MSPTARAVLAAKLASASKEGILAPLAAGLGNLVNSAARAPGAFMAAARGTPAPNTTQGKPNTSFQGAQAGTSNTPVNEKPKFTTHDAATERQITQAAGQQAIDKGDLRGHVAKHLPGLSGRSGAGIGALLGAGLGALNPGKDDDGESRGILSGAIRGALGGGIAGGAAGSLGRHLAINPVREAHGATAGAVVHAGNAVPPPSSTPPGAARAAATQAWVNGQPTAAPAVPMAPAAGAAPSVAAAAPTSVQNVPRTAIRPGGLVDDYGEFKPASLHVKVGALARRAAKR